MLKLNPIALSLVCGLSVAGCASITQKTGQPAAVQPVIAVNHAGYSAESLYRLGRSFEGQGRYEQAIGAYREALRRDPRMVDAYTGLGMALAAQQRYQDAIRQFQAAVVLAPEKAYLHNNLGYAYMLAGQYTEAVTALEEAQRLDGSHEKTNENLRLARERLGPAPAPVSAPVAASSPVAATPVVQVRTQADAMAQLVEVVPQIYELRFPPDRTPILMQPLPPLPQAAPAPKQEPQAAAPSRRFRLEVSNGNGANGMAKRVSGHLARSGTPAVRLTNAPSFTEPRTVIEYRAGYEGEARELKAKLQPEVGTVRSENLASHIDVRLVLGRDVLTDTALVLPPTPAKPVVATVASR